VDNIIHKFHNLSKSEKNEYTLSFGQVTAIVKPFAFYWDSVQPTFSVACLSSTCKRRMVYRQLIYMCVLCRSVVVSVKEADR